MAHPVTCEETRFTETPTARGLIQSGLCAMTPRRPARPAEAVTCEGSFNVVRGAKISQIQRDGTNCPVTTQIARSRSLTCSEESSLTSCGGRGDRFVRFGVAIHQASAACVVRSAGWLLAGFEGGW
jgi:hypothetical protein